jgi:hypothetical protein
MTLEEFKRRFANLRARGFIQSMRSGPTGIGHTLENALRLQENNLAVPDLGEIELKARRENASNLITLFTFNRRAWVMNPLQAIRRYGTLDANGRRGMYFTMSTTPNGAGLFMQITDEAVWVQHTSGQVIVRWDMGALVEQFRRKIPALILVTAHVEQRGGTEYFHYYRAQLLSGTSPHVIANQLRYGNMVIDLRLHDRGTMARNHGTGFRCPESRLDRLFERIEEL